MVTMGNRAAKQFDEENSTSLPDSSGDGGSSQGEGAMIGKERFEGFAKIAFEGLVIHEGGRIIDANEAFIQMLGYTLEEIRGADGFAMLSPTMVEQVKAKIASGYEGTHESCFRRKDGTIFPVEVRVKETKLDGRRVRVAAIRDLTRERQQAEQLKAIFESSPDCILVWDRQYNYLYANRAAMEYAPIESARSSCPMDVTGKNIRDALSHVPDFMHLWMRRLDEVFRTGEVLRVEDSGMIANRMVYSESVLSPIRYPDGQIFAVGVVYRDVTKQKQLLRELEMSRQRYRDLYNHAQVALFVTNLQGLLLDCNLKTLDLFGFSRDEPREHYIQKVNVTGFYNDKQRRREFIGELQRYGQVRGFEAELKRDDGKLFWVSISATLTPEKGTIEGAMHDITAEKELTAAEKKVLKLVLQGMSNREIANQLHRSVRTIEDHRAHIMQKLGVHNLVELVHKTSMVESKFNNYES